MAKPLIATDVIYRKALGLLDAEGPNALNARRLAAELRCSTRTLYEQTGKRDALIRQLVRFHFTRLQLDFVEHRRWQDSAMSWCAELRRALLAHPHLTRLMTDDDRDIIVQHVDRMLKILVAAGFTRALALQGGRVLLHTTIGLALSELQQSEQSSLRKRKPGQALFNQAVSWLVKGLESDGALAARASR